MWVKVALPKFVTKLVVLEEKMVNEGLRCFFLVNGKRVNRLPQHFACLKKETFGEEKKTVDFAIKGKKKEISLLVAFCLRMRTKWERSKQKLACFKKQQKSSFSSIFFGNRPWYCFISAKKTWKRRNAWKRERLCNVGKPTGSKTLSWDFLFFPLYDSSESEAHTLNWSCSMSKWNQQNAWSNAFAHFYFGESTTYSLNEKKHWKSVLQSKIMQ